MDSPVFNKVLEAAEIVAKSKSLNEHALSPTSKLLKGRHGCSVHVDYQPKCGGIILAFVGDEDWNELTKDRYSGRVVPSWSPNKDAKVHKQMLAGVDSLIKPRGDTPSLMDTMVFLSGGFIPRRVTCVGYCIGGGYATIAAFWAAMTIPTADIRCISFGSPRVGSKEFAFAFVNSVATSFRVVYEADPAPHHPRPVFYQHVSQPIWIHDGKFRFTDERSIEQRATDHDFSKYLTSIRDKAGVKPDERAIGADTITGMVVDTAGAVGGAAVDAVGGVVEGGVSMVSGWFSDAMGASGDMSARGADDYVVQSKGGTPKTIVPLLMEGKIAQASLLAMHAYDEEEDFRKNTGLRNARLLSCNELDTQVYVSWLEGGTAIFAFRGTESAKDAQADLDARTEEVDWMGPTFEDIRAHMGFMNQFQSVTNPDVPERHIGMVFEEISGGATPTRVLCCGHSLGGALATLAASWSAYQYPDADIRCVTLGSPRVGNPAFVTAVRYLVGNMFRLVHGWDPVPTVPPPGPPGLNQVFKHVKGRMWLHAGQAELCKRPWYCSYGIIAGKVGDHFLGPYLEHVSKVTGRKIVAEELGLIRGGDDNEGALEVRPAAQQSPTKEATEAAAEFKPDLPATDGKAAPAAAEAEQKAEAAKEEAAGKVEPAAEAAEA